MNRPASLPPLPPGILRDREHEHSFQEVLGVQLRKAPYLLASLAIHGFIILAVAGFMFVRSGPSEAPVIQVTAPQTPPEIETEEPPPEKVVEEPIEEPVLQENDAETVTEEAPEVTGDVEFPSDQPAFDADSFENTIGLGSGGGGKYGQRGSRGHGRLSKGSATEKAVRLGLQWLADHQATDGFWDCDEFMYEDKLPDQPPSDGPGSPTNDVGVTGLALLAFLGNGSTISSGPYRERVARGIRWLKEIQLDSGLFGDEVGNATLYNHAIATMAMGEAYYFSRVPILVRPMRKAVSVILQARNPYGAWRYALQPNGDNDTSITGWMVFALKTAEDGKIQIPHDAYRGAEAWFDQMTDKTSGRTGYTFGEGGGPGSLPSRPLAYLERFPPEKSESLTAVALLSRIFMADTSKIHSWKELPDYDILNKQADLIAGRLPVWDPDGGACDMYYWYYATFAMNQWGGEDWNRWRKAIEKALLPHQRQDGNFQGSWDPAGPWGEQGGRVYSTAICTLILEVYYRYARILGAR